MRRVGGGSLPMKSESWSEESTPTGVVGAGSSTMDTSLEAREQMREEERAGGEKM